MPTGPCARVTDNVLHPLPPVLTPGIGSLQCICGFLPVWRGVPAGVASALQTAKKASEVRIKAAEAATAAAMGTPGAPAAKAAEMAMKVAEAAAMASMMSSMAGMADKHICGTFVPPPPHGLGVVIDGSKTVQVDNLPVSRMLDTILESIGPPNKIMKGQFNVIVGG